MLSNQYGNQGDPNRGMDPRFRTMETNVILDCLVYLPCLLHPILLLVINQDYRQGLRNVWQKLYCNQDTTSRGSNRQHPPGGNQQLRYQRPKPIIKSGKRREHESLIAEVQPMIQPAKSGLKNNYPGYYPQPGNTYIPMETMPVQAPLLGNNSFETEHSPKPALPAEFEYGKFKYVDTARVEPKIAYTPTNTPPKTPQMPHFDKAPFKQPNYIDGTWIMPEDTEAYRGKG